MRRRVVIVNDKMAKGYRYVLSAPAGRSFHAEFKPQLTPSQMLLCRRRQRQALLHWAYDSRKI